MQAVTRALRHINAMAVLSALAGLASLSLPWFNVRPNRVMPSGQMVTLFNRPTLGWVGLLAWVALLGAAGLPAGRLRQGAVAVAVAAAGGFVALAVGHGSLELAGAQEFARVGLAAGAWVAFAAVYVGLFSVFHDAPRLLFLPIVVIVAVIVLAPYGQLGVLREYQLAADTFDEELKRHLLLALAALPLVLLLGLPLGVFAARQPAFEDAILGTAGFLQTIPSVALFGVLLPVLSGYGRAATVAHVTVVAGVLAVLIVLWRLAHRTGSWRRAANALLACGLVIAVMLLLPVLALTVFQLLSEGAGWLAQIRWSTPLHSLGLRGLGVTPALVALSGYGVLPLIVNTHVGLKGVPAGVVESARGMGMSAWQIFWRVEVPIALPFLVEGLRGSLLLLIGLATVAVLVNAGGLGYFLMRGMEQSVLDLVLLGSIPVVLLALGVDGFARAAGWWLTPKGLRS